MGIDRSLLAVFVSAFLPLLFGNMGLCLAGQTEKQWEISAEQKAFLENLERDTFNFFWQTTNPRNGLTPDHFPNPAFASVAGVGFALTAYTVGVERGYITRSQAADRTLTTLQFLFEAPQGPGKAEVTGYKGFFYHFLKMDTGTRFEDSELSTIDTALLIAGVLSSQAYFDGDNDMERKIQDYTEALYLRVDWPWAYSQAHKPLLSMGWHPETGFITYYWTGYNEAMILYILALASPTHAIEPQAWGKWTSNYKWESFYGYPHVNFGPLFGHQYSHVWVDFREIQDEYMRSKGIDYFINSRRATYSNRAYCIHNPEKWRGYNENIWGLTASNGPRAVPVGDGKFSSYLARGCSSDYLRDDGTLAPTAAGGSVAFAPEIVIPTLKHLRDEFGERIYGEFGFKDAFNLSYQLGSSTPQGWFADNYLAIDQGPILLMIENYRTGFVWDLMRKNKHIQDGLRRAGFVGGWLDRSPSDRGIGQQASSSPKSEKQTIQFLKKEMEPEIPSPGILR